MTLNEATLAGLPVVASDVAGAAWDLVEDGRNGFRVPAGDVDALSTALGKLTDDELRRAAGSRSREISAGFTAEAWAEVVEGLAARLANGVSQG